MQAVRSAAASARSLFTAAPRPAFAASSPLLQNSSSRSTVGNRGASRNLMMGRTMGVMGGLRGTFALGPFAMPSLTPQSLLGFEQTRSMRHGQRRGKLGRNSTER